MFQAFYESPWQHPVLLLVVPLWFLAKLLKYRGANRRSLLVFTWLTILDPLATGPISEALALPAEVAQLVGLFFVVLGDFRWFFFFEAEASLTNTETPRWASVSLRAFAWSLLVPILQGALIQSFPERFEDSRWVFLAYELLFLALAAGFLLGRLPRKEPLRSFRKELCFYALGYYALWALSDVLILASIDGGYLLRVVPNQLYYSLFLPFVFFRARHWSSQEEL